MEDWRKQNLDSADYYGYEAQSNQLIEEMAELIQAVNKHKRVLNYGQTVKLTLNDAVNNISEEIADVELMLAQIKHLLGINPKYVEQIKIGKVNRTKERIVKEMRLNDI